MQHSIKDIGERYEEISTLRGDEKPFSAKDYFEFAVKNKNKYSLVESVDDYLVSSWYADELIKDYIDDKNRNDIAS